MTTQQTAAERFRLAREEAEKATHAFFCNLTNLEAGEAAYAAHKAAADAARTAASVEQRRGLSFGAHHYAGPLEQHVRSYLYIRTLINMARKLVDDATEMPAFIADGRHGVRP